MFKIGIDVGGTFTDFVIARDGEEPRYFKTPSTPHDPSEAVAAGLADAASAYGLNARDLLNDTTMLIHGSTVATNTLVERKGARVALLTTEGFRDVLEMRDGLKEDRYNLHLPPINPLVPRYLRLGVRERVRFDGSVETPLDESSLADALDRLAGEDIDALAVCLLFSYVNPDHERRIGEAIRSRFPDLYTSLSHRVLPQIKEFDRVSTTVVNAYVGPVFGEYLKRLRERLADTAGEREILIMQSNGGVATLEDSRRQAVRAILSGPAGGVAGATRHGWLAGAPNLIGFDMGGTSTDISLVEAGEPHLAIEKFEAGWKIATPMIDIHTLGAGGGSIARVDEGGILRVGPDSAGASPGPACYGKGGDGADRHRRERRAGLPGPGQLPRRPRDPRPGRRERGPASGHSRAARPLHRRGCTRRPAGRQHSHGGGHQGAMRPARRRPARLRPRRVRRRGRPPRHPRGA